MSDVRFAQEMGYRIKLLAVAELDGDTLELHVSPTLVRSGLPLADVSGPFNAIRVVGDAVGPLFFHGQGAGQMPTASAVVADMIDTAVGRTAITFRTLELWSNRKARVTPRDHAKADGRFYLRVDGRGPPGRAGADRQRARASTRFRSPRCCSRKPPTPTAIVPLVIMTHKTTEGATRKACAEIDKLACVRGKTVRMWVRD